MQSIVQLIISIIDTIKAWITRRDEKKEKQDELVAKAEDSLKKAAESGDIADLFNAAKELNKARKQ